MALMASVPRPDTSTIPDAPGAYLFRDADGRVVYVGKAISLRKRLASYWGRPLHPRTEAMLAAARGRVDRGRHRGRRPDARVQPHQVAPAAVQRPLPRRQVLPVPGADGGGDVAPGAGACAGAKRKGVRYFGPYGHAYAIRETLDALTRVFPVRTCSNSFFDQRARARRPCLYYDIGRCAGPCVP